MNDQFRTTWDEYIAALEGLGVVGVGVTDYFTTEGYRKVRERQKADGRLGGVLLFANVEMRLSIATKDDQAVNVHLLVSPEDHEHLEKINDKLALLQHRFNQEDYSCTPSGLRNLGRAWHAHSRGRSLETVRLEVDDVGALRLGANQFKIEFTSLCKWRDADPWLKANTLLAVPNGSDGHGGLPKSDDSTWAALREELRRCGHIILSSNAKDREYWLGRGADAIADLERKYGGCKPCLHGSDAHDERRLANPGDRLCWIKAEPTWRGFLQVIAEPDDRVFVGPVPPEPPRTSWIKRVEISGDGWCPVNPIELNAGLVAIIGARGSGKTALADVIAYGADAYERGPASFLSKARKFVRASEVTLTWGDDTKETLEIAAGRLGTAPVDFSEEEARSRVLYLSQHFVESLCDPDGRRDRLSEEVERVVFERLEPDERLDASNFRELLTRETEALHESKRLLEAEVRRRSSLVAQEHAAERRLGDMKKRLADLAANVARLAENLKRTAPPKAQEKQAELTRVQAEVTKKEDELRALAMRAKAIEALRIELRSAADDARRKSMEIAARVRTACPELTAEQVNVFSISFAGDVDHVLSAALNKVQREITASRGPAEPPFPAGSYVALKVKLAEAQKALQDAGVVEKNLADLIKAHAAKTQEHKALATQVEHVGKAKERIREHQTERLASYKRIIEQLGDEEKILRRLYRPLEQELGGMPASERRLALTVERRIDVDDWVRRGTNLFDMRKRHPVTETGKLRDLAIEHLLPAWEGNVDAATAMTDLARALGDTQKLQDCFASEVTLEAFASWLFSTEHIRVDYRITYDNTSIDDLSPGTRGVVLLIIYLRLDTRDDRPLIIDQPEENLDPKSVFTDLVRFFKDARRRRQIIMVTHNANLVVNADADQILIADGERGEEPGPPRLKYTVGVLEDAQSQREICAILEGGVEAFRQRDLRYRVAMAGRLN